MGCMKYGNKYKEGERFEKNHFRYECKNGMVDIIGKISWIFLLKKEKPIFLGKKRPFFRRKKKTDQEKSTFHLNLYNSSIFGKTSNFTICMKHIFIFKSSMWNFILRLLYGSDREKYWNWW